jgi:hypothetical protein
MVMIRFMMNILSARPRLIRSRHGVYKLKNAGDRPDIVFRAPGTTKQAHLRRLIARPLHRTS